jgi:methyl-accepting chemotaxis protein
MKIRSKVFLSPAVAIAMLVVMAAFVVTMTWQLKQHITAFHGGALQQYESSLTASGRLFEANALAYRTLTWSANLSKDELLVARRKTGEIVTEAARQLGIDLRATPPEATARLHADLVKFGKMLDRALELSAVGADDGIAMMRDADKMAVALGQEADRRVKQARTAADGLYQDAEAAFKAVLGVVAAVLVIAVAVSVGVAWWVARSLLASVAHANATATRLAAGDLSFDVHRHGDDEVGDLLASLGRAVTGFRSALQRVQQSSDSIHTASGEVASGNSDLSSRTEQQASSLQQTAASMEELTSTVQTSAANAREANLLAGSATEVAVRGGAVVGEVVNTMEQIQASSQRIAEIIGVIDGIAFQTNILALNAAVEAARAGDQGRGFAVVASEVRSLAQRSAQAAREIKSLIGASVERVDTGSRLVGDAGKTMGDIVSQVRRVSTLIGEIAAAADEQSAGIGQVNQAVTQLDQMTQQNAALVEQGAAAAESLKDQARNLTQAVSAFKLGA